MLKIRMRYFVFLVLIFAIQVAFAQTQKSRIENAYIENDKRFELSCYYFSPSQFRLITPKSNTQRNYGKLSREFEIISQIHKFHLTYTVQSSPKAEAIYMFNFNNGLTISGTISKKSPMLFNNGKNAFYIPTKRVDREFKSFVLDNEINKISCRILFATEKKTQIVDANKKLHINVHPHDRYDPEGLTIRKTEAYFADTAFESYTLLEEGNFKGNLVDLSDFLQMKNIDLIKNYYPESIIIPSLVQLRVSPAGHNRYEFSTDQDVNITYTGGNHNYCMWNNTRRILMAYMRSNLQSKLTINYDTSAIVVQAKGLVGLNFNSLSLMDGNLLKRVFENDQIQANAYTKKYFDYFAQRFFSIYKGLFAEVRLNNKSKYGNFSEVIRGHGDRILEVNLNYIDN